MKLFVQNIAQNQNAALSENVQFSVAIDEKNFKCINLIEIRIKAVPVMSHLIAMLHS